MFRIYNGDWGDFYNVGSKRQEICVLIYNQNFTLSGAKSFGRYKLGFMFSIWQSCTRLIAVLPELA